MGPSTVTEHSGKGTYVVCTARLAATLRLHLHIHTHARTYCASLNASVLQTSMGLMYTTENTSGSYSPVPCVTPRYGPAGPRPATPATPLPKPHPYLPRFPANRPPSSNPQIPLVTWDFPPGGSPSIPTMHVIMRHALPAGEGLELLVRLRNAVPDSTQTHGGRSSLRYG